MPRADYWPCGVGYLEDGTSVLLQIAYTNLDSGFSCLYSLDPRASAVNGTVAFGSQGAGPFAVDGDSVIVATIDRVLALRLADLSLNWKNSSFMGEDYHYGTSISLQPGRRVRLDYYKYSRQTRVEAYSVLDLHDGTVIGDGPRAR